jgi:hypothetical protein
MANVFGGGGNCGTGGVQKVLPTSPDVTQSTQTFSTQPNIYSKPQSTTENIDLRDFYTKVEINKVLKTKANIGSVYDKDTVDSLIQTLEGQINSSTAGMVTDAELSQQLLSLSQTLLGDIQTNYYGKSVLYTKYEIDELIAEVTTDPDDFITKAPTSLLQNTINPLANEAIPLTLIASSSPDVDVVQQWIDNESNSIGRIRTSGQIEFYGNLFLGQNIESWRPALDVSERRIAGVADPIHVLDAVNKGFMEDYITEVIDNVVQGDDKNYIIDALVY